MSVTATDPHFIIIGAQKGGTTSLFTYLIQHPNVVRPVKKELHFFDIDHNYRRGLPWYRALFPPLSPDANGRTCITGEATPFYLFDRRVPERIAGALPDIKLIAVLRNPVERAYSHYQMAVRKGFEHLTFEEAVEAERSGSRREEMSSEMRYLRWFTYLERGIYVDQLSHWARYFPREQMLILKAEDMFANPAETMHTVLGFLGLPSCALAIDCAYNAYPYAPLAPDIRAELLRYFEPHNQRLYEFLGRDFGWK